MPETPTTTGDGADERSVGTSAVIGTTAIVKGTILADQSIAMNTGATLDGRALARIAQVTMLSNTVTVPAP